MYVIEISLRLSPIPLTVQRKELNAAEDLFRDVRQAMDTGNPKLLDISCEKEESKRLSLLSADIQAVQMYEKSAGGTGGKRPGFSFES